MNFELGPKLMWVHSPASLSNGFKQAIPSTTTGVALGGTFELGGTIPDIGLVLGAAIGDARVEDPTVSTLGQRFTITHGEVSLFSIQGFARYYPNPKQGLHFGVSMGGLGLERACVGGGQLSGRSFSIEAGDGVWLARPVVLRHCRPADRRRTAR